MAEISAPAPSRRLRLLSGMRSLRFRFAAATAMVLGLAVILLTLNSLRVLDANIIARENERLDDFRQMLTASITSHLQRKQFEQIRYELRKMRREDQIPYLVLLDRNQRILIAEGWDVNQPLPARKPAFEGLPEGGRFDTFATLMDDQSIEGYIVFGVATTHLREARRELVWQNLGIGAVALLISVIAALGIGSIVTRDLRVLRSGVVDAEIGNLKNKLPVRRNDETGDLTRSFNRMIQVLDERMKQLARSEARFHAIADYTYGIEAWFNPEGRLIWINRSIERITGYTALECVLAGSVLELLVHAPDRRAAQEAFVAALQGRPAENFEARVERKNGSVIWVAFKWQPIYGAAGEYLGLRVSADDISLRKEAEVKLLDTVVELRREQSLKEYYLNRSEEERWRLAALLDVLQVGILFVGRDRRVVYCNKAFQRIWSFPENEGFDGVRDTVILDRTAAQLTDAESFRRHVFSVIKSRDPSATQEIQLKDGRTLTGTSTVVSSHPAARHVGRVWLFEDVTEQKRAAARLTQLAEHDALTGLYNRRRFYEELERNLADAARRQTEMGVLVMDLDGFKPINDEFGHHAGDEVLIAIAREVGSVVRRNEMFFRLGGDEFAVLAPDATEFEMVGLARRIASRVAEVRFTFDGRVARTTASLGIALFPRHGTRGAELVARADSAMYQAKTAGKNHWRIYRSNPSDA